MNQYEIFYGLHQQSAPLIIANAWNVKSAKIIESNGYDAVATSSGAIADSLGYPDGEAIPFNELLYMVRRIKASINIPLSVDLEKGYTEDLTVLNSYVQQLLDAGVAGINLEDTHGEKLYIRKLSSIKDYLVTTHQSLFINARTDAFLLKLPSALDTTLRRIQLYEAAGAHGIFVTAIRDAVLIKEIVSSTSLPVNVVGVPGLTSVELLSQCGVRRISMAVLPFKTAYGHLNKVLKAVKDEQSFEPLYKQ